MWKVMEMWLAFDEEQLSETILNRVPEWVTKTGFELRIIFF
jgi:hypothetical protein